MNSPSTLVSLLLVVSLSALPLRAQRVTAGDSESVTLSVGAAAGVREGLNGKLCAPEMVGGRIVVNCFARFVVVSVSSETSTAKITKASGREIRKGLLVRFDSRLVAPVRPRDADKKKKTESRRPQRDEATVALSEADRAFDGADWRGALERYETFLKRFPDHDRVDAVAERAEHCRSELEKISANAATVAAATADRRDAPPVEVVEAEQLALSSSRLFDSGNLAEARSAATQALKRDSTNPRARAVIQRIRLRSVSSRFHTPSGIAAAGLGACFVADTGNNTIRKVTASTTVTVAGAAGEFGANDGPAAVARFNAPAAVALTPDGTAYIADRFNATVRRISPEGRVTTIAGRAGAIGATTGPAAMARFDSPAGIAVAADGTIYISDTGNHAIRRISRDGTVETVVTAQAGERIDPAGVAVASDGAIYFADPWNHVVRKIDPTGAVTVFAGVLGVSGSADGAVAAARFNAPTGVAVDSSGAVYVADAGDHTIRKIADGVVATVAGKAGVAGDADGAAVSARFNAPAAVACDGPALWIADTGNHTVRQLSEGFVHTVAGLAGNAGSADGAN